MTLTTSLSTASYPTVAERVNPTLTGVQVADLGGGGLLAAFSIVTALLARERMGEGQLIDVPHDGWGAHLELPALGKIPRRWTDSLSRRITISSIMDLLATTFTKRGMVGI